MDVLVHQDSQLVLTDLLAARPTAPLVRQTRITQVIRAPFVLMDTLRLSQLVPATEVSLVECVLLAPQAHTTRALLALPARA